VDRSVKYLKGKTQLFELFRIEKSSGEVVAIKEIDLDLDNDDIKDVQAEIAILKELNSPFVPKYYGSYLLDSKLWIVMEYMGGGSCLDHV
jgi:serine/threonine-protein kinase 24/25/MST4